MSFLNNLSLPISQNYEIFTPASKENGHDSLFDHTLVMSKEPCENW